MREIKFRAWHELDKKMIYPEDFRGLVGSVHSGSEVLRRFDEEHCMQYTGLKDKNGKEIYEGDIVDLIPDGVVREPAQVCWNDDSGGWIYRRISSMDLVNGQGVFPQWKPVEVIGNIYQDSHLLD